MSGRVKRLFGSQAPWLLIGWTIFLWVSRLRNVLADDDLSSTGRSVRIGIVVLFVVLAAAAAVGRRRGSHAPLMVLIVWTIGYWIVRGGGILIGDWSAGFKVVHTVLMIVSLTAAGLAARSIGWAAGVRGPARAG